MNRNNRIHYDHRLVERSREMRNNPTPAERKLWERLKGKKLLGYDFHRQKPIGHFIVDFYCAKLFLAIEIDGSSHDDKKEADEVRQNALGLMGISFLRFTNDEVRGNIDGVIKRIKAACGEKTIFVTNNIDKG